MNRDFTASTEADSEAAASRSLAEQQARRMETAYAVIQAVHGDLSIEKVATTIVENLVELGGFVSAALTFKVSIGSRSLTQSAEAGNDNASGLLLRTVPIFIRGQEVGAMKVTCAGEQSSEEQFELLEWVLPTLIMSLDNAVSFAEVSDYRQTLEQRVADRTAELAEARDNLQKTVLDLEEAQAVRSRIFANINHEIRTPLSLVLLSASELRSRYSSKTDERSLANVANIEGACERLLSMVDNLLLLAAGQEGKLKIQPRECDLAIEIAHVVSIWTPLAKQHKLQLSYAGPQQLPAFLDTAALERILANLVSNAIKYTPDGGSIEVSLTALDDSTIVSVRDTGVGIDDDFRKRIFGRFEQGRPAIRQGARSSGIGLSIVKELVEAHNGTVTVESNGGVGTIFRVTFPSQRSHDRIASPLPSGHALPMMANLAASFGLSTTSQESTRILSPNSEVRATVLVAEDDAALRTSIGELLLTAGYRVLLAADGFSALTLAAEHHPDMLVSDVGMPGMDGYELSRRFREARQNRLAPVLLLTAYGTMADKLSGFQAGAVDYMIKPFEPRELLVRVDSQLKVRDLALRLSDSEKLASLGTMSAGLAHEMRNPANGLLNALDPLVSLLPEDMTTPESATGQLLEVVRDCAQQIGRLSKQLLGFKREGTLLTAEEDIAKLLARAIGMLDAKTRNVEIRSSPSYIGRVSCAGPMLLQVLVNLLDNAIHAAGDGGTVEIVTKLDGERVLIDISDSGPGVPIELRERIFEPFFTTKGPGIGTGLGLSTSRQIVDQHQGTLRVVEGTRGTFRIELPLNGPNQVSVATNKERDPRPEHALS